MSGFGEYLKDYLEFNNISQSEFASRLNISQKHMNEILNDKQDITLEMAGNISRLTDIPITFIINSENRKYIIRYLKKIFESEKDLQRTLKKEFFINELNKTKWVDFKDITNPVQNYIDLINFLHVKDFNGLSNIQEKTLFKKTGENINKLSLWIAKCDELSNYQKVNEYNSANFHFLMQDLKNESYEGFDIEKIKQILNIYGIYFVVKKALDGTKVRGCFKVKGKNPAIYLTQNYKTKDSFFFELFHELGHCKSDYNVAKSKVIIEGEEIQEKRADNFALNTMIPQNIWEEIEKNYQKENLLNISKKYKISMSFIVGRLAKNQKITYKSSLYNKYKMV